MLDISAEAGMPHASIVRNVHGCPGRLDYLGVLHGQCFSDGYRPGNLRYSLGGRSRIPTFVANT